MSAFLSCFAQMSAAGSLMILLLLFLRYILLRRMPSGAYYYLWILVLLRFVLPIPGPGFIQERPQEAASTITELRQEETDHVQRPMPDLNNSETELEKGHDVQLFSTEESRERRLDLGGLHWEKLIFALWLGGALISLSRYILGYLRFSALIRKYPIPPETEDLYLYRRLHKGSKPELIRSDYVRTPMLLGLFSPVLVLPDRDYSQSQLKNIFLHELMHFSRRDILYKWLSVPVYALQWFNPLVCIMRREINRACELSCDELIIRKMDSVEKQSYGDTLIALASGEKHPPGIVATTFTTEKRHLKERLVKIMNFRERKISRILALLLALTLLAGCGAVAGPAAAEKESGASVEAETLAAAVPGDRESDVDPEIRKVSSVDELLAAIASDSSIQLAPGEYVLSQASDYGENSSEKSYRWEECYDGYELVLSGIENLRLIGDDSTLSTQPRYANVLRLEGCMGLKLENLTVGHTEGQGFCSGGVLYLDSCTDVMIGSCRLFGCGTIGIFTQNSKRIYAENTEIYDCTYNAVYSVSSSDIRLDSCSIYNCSDGMVQSIFAVDTSMGFAVVNCRIYNNTALTFIDSTYSQQVNIMGCEVQDNIFTDSLFSCSGYPVTVDASLFEGNHYAYYITEREWIEAVEPVDIESNALREGALLAMEHSEAVYEGPRQAEPVELDETVGEDGLRHVNVTTVDEFLAAIGNNTVIHLDGELFDLSTASDYGAYGNDYYYWIDVYDGPGLVISGVDNLSIVGDGAVIAAIPRYANVLGFANCCNIRLEGFTAGHTQEPGECAGGVLDLVNCDDFDIINCHLYGCGILGISASGGSELFVENTEIYECSQGAIALYGVKNAKFEDCDIHDCHSPEIFIHDGQVLFHGETLRPGAYSLTEGVPEEYIFR